MRIKTIVLLLLLGLLPALAVCQEAGHGSRTELAKQAKISKDQATKVALARVPNGTIQEGELEREHGRLVWSFDIATPGTKVITEVQVDAKTGKVASVTHESAKAEAAEKKNERKTKKK